MKNHPDKGGDAEKFKELTEAYEVLSDPEMRKIYDLYRHEDPTEEIGEDASSDDDPNFSGRMKKRGIDVVHPLEVSLEDLYNGATKKFSVPRNVLCGKCRGKGRKGTFSKCPACRGLRYKVIEWEGLIPLLAGAACPECRGSGKVYIDLGICPQCKGNKVTQQKKKLKVRIEKGMQHGQKITFKRQADEAPDTGTGDIFVFLEHKRHPTFVRMMDDLQVDCNLSLTEAACGFEFALTHLDGREILIKSKPGEVIKPETFREGQANNPFQYYSRGICPEQCRKINTKLDVGSEELKRRNSEQQQQ
ncbi:DnaJ protein-like protein ANJ1 [Hibiscus syriacus]|uniref:DnaJ protein-like protein ANJ1 n=1 Tax=Hibiscus syriacus TaxID=106335 RepID=A0A6A3CYR3_HIBSY|nr:DnaJ protein-like protein ANJ1 [Hibiscus syriacus]